MIKLKELEIGTSIGDMHDGLGGVKFDIPVEIDIITFPVLEGSKIINKTMKDLGLKDYHYLNKMLIVVEIGWRGTVKALYSYDDHYMGVVTLTPKVVSKEE